MPQQKQNNFFDESNDVVSALNPEQRVLNKIQQRTVEKNRSKVNENASTKDNVIYGKFSKQKEKEEKQEYFQNNAAANLPKSLQNMYDPEKRFAANDNKSESEKLAEINNIDASRRRLETEQRLRQNKDNQMQRAMGLNAANDNFNTEQNDNNKAKKMNAIIAIFRAEKINISESEAESMLKSGMKIYFPYYMLMLAVLKDLIDMAVSILTIGFTGLGVSLSSTGIGSALGVPLLGLSAGITFINSAIISPAYIIIFNIWLRKYSRNKSGFNLPKLHGKLVKKILPRLLAKSIIEIIPFLNTLPINSYNVYSVSKIYRRMARKVKAVI